MVVQLNCDCKEGVISPGLSYKRYCAEHSPKSIDVYEDTATDEQIAAFVEKYVQEDENGWMSLKRFS